MTEYQLNEIAAWFTGFVATFRGESSAEQRTYDLKIVHTHQVCAIIKRLAVSLGLASEERALATAIAICHDVGRFPQYRRYGTFNDAASTNHAALGIQTLKAEGVIDALAADERSVLLAAVALHNVFLLSEDLDPAVRRFTLLLRDADKLDIWRVLIETCTAGPEERASAVFLEQPDTGHCSPRALAEVVAGRMPNRELLATADDLKLLQLSWVYDLNFAESFQIMAERDYLEALANLLPDQAGCREAVEVVRAFVQARLG
jgi:hypothetical protein